MLLQVFGSQVAQGLVSPEIVPEMANETMMMIHNIKLQHKSTTYKIKTRTKNPQHKPITVLPAHIDELYMNESGWFDPT